ncbi:MAG: hypothetical protein DMG05_17935 [Acidobacteria bacterium]|nr:MAG: hypothetical protein DMG05_17935 [Acidobacteriota bacterium]
MSRRKIIVHGINPSASVFMYLFDREGNLRRSGSVVVQSNELVQINDIINELPTIEDPVQGGNVGTGWLLIFSDEPLTAWASVISNSNDDPSVELAIADQIYKPAAFVESAGTRLAVQSSAKTARFQSSLLVVNVGSDDGNLYVDIWRSSRRTVCLWTTTFGVPCRVLLGRSSLK